MRTVNKESVTHGEIRLGSNLSVGYLTQHMIEMDGYRSKLDEFRD